MSKVILPTDLTGKNVFIAGSAGFVPSHVTDKFLSVGATVYGIDNFVTGTESNVNAIKNSRYHFEKFDLIQGLPEGFNSIKFDYILSLASPASPIDFRVIPLEIMQVNSQGTFHLLERAKRDGARFLEASTSEVYGDPEIHPQVETYHGNVNPIGGRSCYDEAKRFAEAMTMTYHRKYNVDTRIVRIFNTYGPRMRPDDGRVIPNFINQALTGKDITIYGTGKQTRSFCYVDDLVEAIYTVAHTNEVTPYNIGNPDEYSVEETAKFILDALKSDSKISYQPLPYEDDPKKRRPNIDKIQSVSDYAPKVSFADGLAQTAEYFKSLM